MEMWKRPVKLRGNSQQVHHPANPWVLKRTERKYHSSEINDCLLLITSLTCY